MTNLIEMTKVNKLEGAKYYNMWRFCVKNIFYWEELCDLVDNGNNIDTHINLMYL
jgi:hypothetical protein